MAVRGHRGKNASEHAVHRWANQIGESKSSGAIFFQGNTIYSYGHHFPMARHLDDHTILMTTKSYSVTTSGHMSAVRSAASHKKIIYCRHLPKYSSTEIDKELHTLNISCWISDVKDLMTEMAGAKQQRSRDRIAGEIAETQAQAQVYIDYFKIKLTKSETKQLMAEDMDGFVEGVKRKLAADKKRRDALVAKGKKLHPLWLEAWRQGDDHYNQWKIDNKITPSIMDAIDAVEFVNDDRHNKIRLRVLNIISIGKEELVVSTSKGVNIPVDVAHRYYRKYLAVVKAGGCDNNCDYKMLDYNVSRMDAERLVVGCHDIARSEIDYVAGELGWK